MLLSLTIHNLAIIRQATLELGEGLTVITGETGAGKSLVAKALTFVLGGRGSTETIRDGERRLVVEAIFSNEVPPAASALLADLGVPDDEPEWVVRRSLDRDGRNRVLVNGVRLTVDQLRNLGDLLFQGHGQFENQGLLQPAYQRRLVDGIAGADRLVARCEGQHARCAELRRRLDDLQRAADEREQRLDYLHFQRQEIEAAAPRPGEDEELEERHQRLAHVGELRATTASCLERLQDGSPSLLGELATIRQQLARLAELDPGSGELDALAEQGAIALEELTSSLAAFSHDLRDDPAALAEVEERLATLRGLHRKYGGSQEALLDHQRAILEEIDGLTANDADQERLLPELAAAEKALETTAAELTAVRRETGERLRGKISSLLAALEMGGAELEVHLAPRDAVGPHGGEDVELLFAANAGEPRRSLSRIASGGELSRLGLALRRLQVEGTVPTLLFDEVDAGVGGQAGERIGELLSTVAANQQVLCITHLPQVARHGNGHLRVVKRESAGRTEVEIQPLSSEQRVEELARMLGGRRADGAARRHAAALLE